MFVAIFARAPGETTRSGKPQTKPAPAPTLVRRMQLDVGTCQPVARTADARRNWARRKAYASAG
jgi:hypothetical protein